MKKKFPFIQVCLCQVWLKLAQWLWRRGFFNFVIEFSLFRNYLSLEKDLALHLNKFESPSPKDALCQSWLKLGKWFWRRRFFNFVNVFLLIHNYLSLEKGGTLLLDKLESPSPNDALCIVWLKMAQWFWRRRFFNLSIYFRYFVIISPWKRVGPFIWTNLNPHHPSMFCAKFGWNWVSGSGEDF